MGCQCKISLDGEEQYVVNKFRYLGVKLRRDYSEKAEAEIRSS